MMKMNVDASTRAMPALHPALGLKPKTCTACGHTEYVPVKPYLTAQAQRDRNTLLGTAAVSLAARGVSSALAYTHLAPWASTRSVLMTAVPTKYLLDKAVSRGGTTGTIAVGVSGALWGATAVMCAPGIMLASPAAMAGATILSMGGCLAAAYIGVNLSPEAFALLSSIGKVVDGPRAVLTWGSGLGAILLITTWWGVAAAACFTICNGLNDFAKTMALAHKHLRHDALEAPERGAVHAGQTLAGFGCHAALMGITAGALEWRYLMR